MSAPRRLLAWLWAAFWVRWQLTRVKAVRLFGGRRVGVAVPDYHLAPVETPVESVDYDPTELPAELIARLERTRAELRRPQPQLARPAISRGARRRRVASLATAAVLALGGIGAGAAALVTGSTGVPAVDRLLGIYAADVNDPGASGRSGGVTRDIQPDSSGSSTSIEVLLGSRRVVSVSYVARDGRICSALGGSHGDGAGGDVACLAPGRLATRLARRDGVVLATNVMDDQVLVRGFVPARVVSLSGRGPNGSLDVRLGDAWTSKALGVGPLKPFVALGSTSAPGSSQAPGGVDPLMLSDLDSYSFDALTDDGERLRIGQRINP